MSRGGAREGCSSARRGTAAERRSKSTNAAYGGGMASARGRGGSAGGGMCGGGGATPRRKSKPQWDDSLGDPSQYKLTPEEAVQRKMSLVSKHNTLVFGLGHGRGGGGATHASAPAADRKRCAGARVVAGKTVAKTVLGGATRVVGRDDEVVEKEDGIREGGGDSDGNSCSNVRSGGSNGSAARLIGDARERGVPPQATVDVPDVGRNDDDDDTLLCAEDPSGINHGAVFGGGDAIVNDTTVTTTYRYKHHDAAVAAAAAERGESEGCSVYNDGNTNSGDDENDFMGLNDIEHGIQTFSQRVSDLELDRRSEFGNYGEGSEPEEGRGGETRVKGPAIAMAGAVAKLITYREDHGGDFDSGDLEQTFLSRGTIGTEDFEVGDNRDGSNDDRNRSADLQKSSSSGSTDEDRDLVKRIQLLETQVRALQFLAPAPASAPPKKQASDIVGTPSTACPRQRVEEEEDAIKDAAGEKTELGAVESSASAEVRTVMAGLLALSARLLERATTAERRLRELPPAQKNTFFDNMGAVLPVGRVSTSSVADEDMGSLMARGRSIMKENKEDENIDIDAFSAKVYGALESSRSPPLTVDSVRIAAEGAPVTAPSPETMFLPQRYGRKRGHSGGETPAPGDRDRHDHEQRQQWRPTPSATPTQTPPPSSRLPSQSSLHTSAAPTKDRWSDALNAVSSLIARSPVGEDVAAAPVLSAEVGTDFRPIQTFGTTEHVDGSEGQDLERGADSSWFGSCDGGPEAHRVRRPLPRVILAPIHHSKATISRGYAASCGGAYAESGNCISENATSVSDMPPLARAPFSGAPVGAPAAPTVRAAPAGEGVTVELMGPLDYNAYPSVQHEGLAKPPTPSEKPAHPFEHSRPASARHLKPLAPSHRWWSSQQHHHTHHGQQHVSNVAVGETSSRSPPTGGGDGDRGGGGVGDGKDIDGELSCLTAPVGEWYTPPRW